MGVETQNFEKLANQLLQDKAYLKAYELFLQAAYIHRSSGNHQSAAICFASAASCQALASGEQSFYQAAEVYKKAAKEARESGDLKYASILYKQAAICYERDMEYMGFSECFFHSKELYRKHLRQSLFKSSYRSVIPGKKKTPLSSFKKFMRWLGLVCSSALWGHGERPHRTVIFGIGIILIGALIYSQGTVMQHGSIVKLDLWEAIYFSVITFTTVGYGDIIPLGTNKIFVVIESFGGLFIVPIFITGLCRRYLRF